MTATKELERAQITETVKRLVEAAPPLSQAQIERLRAVLRSSTR